MMTPAQNQRIKDLFDEAVEMEPVEQARWLTTVCSDDLLIRSAVEKLLKLSKSESVLLSEGSASTLLGLSPATPNVMLGKQIGVYRLVRELGRGGMGSVYQAERADGLHSEPVAIKLVWPGFSREAILRFQQERILLARLVHPHIARLFDGGHTEDGLHYLVMEYVEGQPITTYCREHKLALNARLALFRTVCEAVQYAHQNLIVHRDLKPANLLVTKDGKPKLLDFGIAKLLERGPSGNEPSTLTRSGQQPFTPQYASPEQIRNEPITTVSDVYSLGALLYELLTGTKPHQAESETELLRLICEVEPPRPSERVTKISGQTGEPFTIQSAELRGDLNNIVLKALSKDISERYASATELSEDIKRFLIGEPVLARKATFLYVANKFLRRHTYAVVMGTTIMLILLAWLFTVYRQITFEREQAQAKRRSLYAIEIQQAAQNQKNDDLLNTQKLLEHWLPNSQEEDLRGFEWFYLWRLAHPEELLVKMPDEISIAWLLPKTNLLYARDISGKHNLFNSITGQVLWDYQEEAKLGDNCLWPVNAEILMRENGNRLVFWDLAHNAKRLEITEPDAPLAFVDSFGLKFFLTADTRGTVKIRDRETGNVQHVFSGIEMPITALAEIGESQAVAVVSRAQVVTILPLSTQQPLIRFVEPTHIKNVSADHKHQRLLTHVSDGINVRDMHSGRLIKKIALPNLVITGFFIAPHEEQIFVALSDYTIRILDAQRLRESATLRGQEHNISSLMVFPEKNWLMALSRNRTVGLWDLNAQKEFAKFRGHTGDVTSASPSADKKKVVTGSQDHTVRIWDIAQAMQPATLRGHTDHILTAAFSPDNQHVATAGKDKLAIISNIQTGAQLTLSGHREMIFTVAFSPDGKRLATGSNDGTAKLWDTSNGKEMLTMTNGKREYVDGVRTVTFTRDGQRLIAGCNDGTIKVWDLNSGQLLTSIQAHQSEVLSVALSPDEQSLVSGGWDRSVKLWNVATWQEMAVLKGHQGKIWSTVFSPDGKYLATGSGDFTVKLWDVASKQVIRTLEGHSDGIFSIAFTPDGKRLVTCSDDKTARIWNPETGEALLTLRDHTDEVWRVAFSPDGRTLLSASWDKTARLYRAANPTNLQP